MSIEELALGTSRLKVSYYYVIGGSKHKFQENSECVKVKENLDKAVKELKAIKRTKDAYPTEIKNKNLEFFEREFEKHQGMKQKNQHKIDELIKENRKLKLNNEIRKSKIKAFKKQQDFIKHTTKLKEEK